MTYQYRCSLCLHEWEEEQSIKDLPFDDCPRCSEKTAVRVVTGGGGFRLKGERWAKDGYG